MSVESDILDNYNVIAVVGLSADESRPSNLVAACLQEHGYIVIPVNPAEKEVLGQTCYPDLKAIKRPIEVVNIFRRSETVPPLIEQAIEIGAKAVWMQEGVINEEAAARAAKAGLKVVMDKCMRKELMRLLRERG